MTIEANEVAETAEIDAPDALAEPEHALPDDAPPERSLPPDLATSTTGPQADDATSGDGGA